VRQRLRLAAVASAMAVIGLAGLVAFAPPAGAQSFGADGEPDAIVFGAGYYDFIRAVKDKGDKQEAGFFNLEYHSNKKLWYFTPQFGAWGTNKGSAYVYAGVRLDVFFGNRIVFTPSFSPGLYHEGKGKDLGFIVEFRSSAELAYRFDDYSRLSLGIAHLSNASLGDKNPGVETLTLTYSIPMSNILGGK
jgi:lipid A 3-O-deacylase